MEREHYDTTYTELSNGSRTHLVRQSDILLHLGGVENVVDKNFSRL
jgi:hypothetical protein